MDKLFYIFVYFLVGLYVAHFFVCEFEVDRVEDDYKLSILVLPLAFILWPAFLASWGIVAIVDMHRRR